MAISHRVGMLAFLLVFLPVSLAYRPVRSIWSDQELIHQYDVVTPILEQPLDQGTHPEKMTIVLELEREKLTLKLTKNKHLLRPSFKYRVQEGQNEQLYEGKENCYYHGKVEEHPDWSVVISTCFGIRGTFGIYSLRNMTFFVEPLEKKVDAKHLVYRASELPDSHFGGKCGSDGHSNPSLDTVVPSAVSVDVDALLRKKRQSSSSTYFLELYVATDTAAYARRRNDRTMLLHEIVEIVNHMDDFYSTITSFKVRMALIEVKAYTSSDPIPVTRDSSATLTLWKAHFRANIHEAVPADAALLFAGGGFNDDVLGIAPVGSMCGSSNAGLTSLRSSTLASATTAAHELGHMFGLNHDDSGCSCADRECIMSARISSIPTQWSSCSQTMFASDFSSGNFGEKCLADEPNFVNTDNVVPYVCGNGIREPGEGCDCGSEQECNDPCCNATTCSLTQGAKCYTHEPCCQNCQYKPAGVQCRSVMGECDVAERCTGSSGECPDDLYLRNGINCTHSNEQGFCIDGQCLTRTSQCQRIYADSAARSAPDICYDYNRQGNCYGKCSIQQPCGTSCNEIPCAQEDVLCGVIRCVTDRRRLAIDTPEGTFFGTLTCRLGGVTTTVFCLPSYPPELTDPAFVQDLTKCGENKVCMNQRCVTADFTSHTCPSNAAGVECNGQGRCLTNNVCLCNEGWFGEKCDRQTPTAAPTTRLTTRSTTRQTVSIPTQPPVPCASFGGIECAGNGQCLPNGTCLCEQGWLGFVCNISACPFGNSSLPCGGRGVCTQQGICACNGGWNGPACDNEAPVQQQEDNSAGGIAAGVIVTLLVVAAVIVAVVVVLIFVIRHKRQGKSISLSRSPPKSQRHSTGAAPKSVSRSTAPVFVNIDSNPAYNSSKEPYSVFRPSPPPQAPSRRPAPSIPVRSGPSRPPPARPMPPTAPPTRPTPPPAPTSRPTPPPAPTSRPTPPPAPTNRPTPPPAPTNRPTPPPPSAVSFANQTAAFQPSAPPQPTAPKPSAPLMPPAHSTALNPAPKLLSAAKPYPKPPATAKPSAKPPLAGKPAPPPTTKPLWPPTQTPSEAAPRPSTASKPAWPPVKGPAEEAPKLSSSKKPVWPPPQHPQAADPKPSTKPVWPPAESNGGSSSVNPPAGRRPLLPPNLR